MLGEYSGGDVDVISVNPATLGGVGTEHCEELRIGIRNVKTI